MLVTSHCDNNEWTEPMVLPGGEYSSTVPDKISTPDKDMICPVIHTCRDLKLTYDPNKEVRSTKSKCSIITIPENLCLQVGAEFFCIPEINPTNATVTNPVRIDDETACVLLCDREPAAHLQCSGTQWAGKPEIGLWCFDKQAPLKLWANY